MVRITGSVKVENILTSPKGDLLVSVVRRNNGKSAKRTSGTESKPPTRNTPSARSAPRNERRPATDDAEDGEPEDGEPEDGEPWGLDGSAAVVSSDMRSPLPRVFAGRNSKIARVRWVLCLWEASDVSHQFLYIGRPDFAAKRRHFSSAFCDHFSKCRVALLLNVVGAEVLRVERLAGWGVAAATWPMTQVAVFLIDSCGIRLRLR
jgi:hypothetical protein